MLILKKYSDEQSHDMLRKQHLCDLPLITRKLAIFDYPISSNNAAAFIYTLFSDNQESQHFHTKGALYSAITFLDRTDLRERGIPIYFTIQDTDYDDLQLYFELAGVKQEHILPFTSNAYGIIKLMDAFYLPELQKYKRLFMIDADVFARPIKRYPLVDEILWDTKKYPLAALDIDVHNDIWQLELGRFHALKVSKYAAEFPKISNTPSDKLLEKITDTTITRSYIKAGFVGFSDTFLAQTAEAYKKIAAFTQKTYPNNKTPAHNNKTLSYYALTEEDLLTLFALEFQLKIYDFDIDSRFHFVTQNDPDRNRSVINHIHSCIDYTGDYGADYEYSYWKYQWLAEVQETLDRL